MASYALHSSPSTAIGFTVLFGVGALIMRGAGCTINDMWDQRLDRQVARTMDRPLARGDLTTRQALPFLALQLSAGLCVLLQLNWYSILLGAASLSVVTIYPLMKRVTYWPQLFLGLAFNWGALLGWGAVANSVNWAVCLPLYAAGISFTIVYDTIYAHQDKADDKEVGIRSTAVLFGPQTRPILTVLSLSSLSLFTLAGILNGQTAPFFVGVTLAGLQLGRILYSTDFNDRDSCWRGFAGCGWSAFWVWIGAAVDYTLLFT